MLYSYEQRKLPLYAANFSMLTKMPHIHFHLELIYLTEGTSVAFADGEEQMMEAGDLYLSFPNQIHYYHAQKPPRGMIAIFAAEIFPDLQELLERKVPKCPVIKKEQLPPDLLPRMKNVVEAYESDMPFGKIEAKGELLLLLTKLLPQMDLVDLAASQDSVKNVLLYCMENYLQPLTLERMAKALHLNKYYISHIFNERIRIPFPEFINQLRMEHACKLLTGGSSITEVAYASGFSSIRTFNRVFLRQFGMSPSAYIKKQEGRA